MKKISAILAAAMTITSVSFASPLTDYTQGKAAIDLNPNINSDSTKDNVSGGITYGVGNKFALQYKYADNKNKNYLRMTPPSNAHAQLSAYEMNVLYQINPNVSAYAGWAGETAKINLLYYAGPDLGNIIYRERGSQSSFHLGLIGQTKFTENLTGWASAGAGSHIIGYEVGLGYSIAKNAECNVIYRYNKYQGFNLSDGKIDVKIEGVGAGITLTF
ncbi:outer membrane beta-barrel protein [Sporomusa termitida]|uniref:Uncharacterized protein n=1 Tax=Sporomusa termitida TaxID=2377 RepID=A0A517DRK9_9FIRM|nr:outer membrane beta-barrel protein [Sporomusa termitida]QDR79994.1 hypothetical protein SPTER_13030 [Sporomusa termitida]